MLADAIAAWADKYTEVPVIRDVTHSMDPATALVDRSAEAALVVVGSRGRTGLQALLFGSVGQSLLRRSACSVAVVP
jgi:nucleotide-binding universal stress UspA family protein